MTLKEELQIFIEQTEKQRSGAQLLRPNVRLPKAFVLRLIQGLPVGMFDHPDLKPLKAYHKANPTSEDCVIPREFLIGLQERL